MVKLSNEKLVNSIQALNMLNQQQLPVVASYMISKNIAKIEKELEAYNAEKQKLIDKYAVKDEEGNPVIENGNITIQKKCIIDWNKDIKELLEIENELDIHQVSIEKLANFNFSISPAHLQLLDYMIVE